MKDAVPCVNCGTFFIPRNRNQNFCSHSACQNARKARWEKSKRQTDPEFRQSRRLSRKKWLENNPGYWKAYRRHHPEQVRRNRVLQKMRNQRRNAGERAGPLMAIAKTDARKPSPIQLSGMFWLVPEIAKTDAVKIYFHPVSAGCR